MGLEAKKGHELLFAGSFHRYNDITVHPYSVEPQTPTDLFPYSVVGSVHPFYVLKALLKAKKQNPTKT